MYMILKYTETASAVFFPSLALVQQLLCDYVLGWGNTASPGYEIEKTISDVMAKVFKVVVFCSLSKASLVPKTKQKTDKKHVQTVPVADDEDLTSKNDAFIWNKLKKNSAEADIKFTTSVEELSINLREAERQGKKPLVVCCNNSARNKFCKWYRDPAQIRKLDLLVMDEGHLIKQRSMLQSLDSVLESVRLFQAYTATPNKILGGICQTVAQYGYDEAVKDERIRPMGLDLFGWAPESLGSFGLGEEDQKNKYTPILLSTFTAALTSSQSSINVIMQHGGVQKNPGTTSVDEFAEPKQQELAQRILNALHAKHDDRSRSPKFPEGLVIKSITADTPPSERIDILKALNERRPRIYILSVYNCVGAGVNTFADFYVPTETGADEANIHQMFGRLFRRYACSLPPARCILPLQVPLREISEEEDASVRSEKLLQAILDTADWTPTLVAFANLHTQICIDGVIGENVYAGAGGSVPVISPGRSLARLEREGYGFRRNGLGQGWKFVDGLKAVLGHEELALLQQDDHLWGRIEEYNKERDPIGIRTVKSKALATVLGSGGEGDPFADKQLQFDVSAIKQPDSYAIIQEVSNVVGREIELRTQYIFDQSESGVEADDASDVASSSNLGAETPSDVLRNLELEEKSKIVLYQDEQNMFFQLKRSLEAPSNQKHKKQESPAKKQEVGGGAKKVALPIRFHGLGLQLDIGTEVECLLGDRLLRSQLRVSLSGSAEDWWATYREVLRTWRRTEKCHTLCFNREWRKVFEWLEIEWLEIQYLNDHKLRMETDGEVKMAALEMLPFWEDFRKTAGACYQYKGERKTWGEMVTLFSKQKYKGRENTSLRHTNMATKGDPVIVRAAVLKTGADLEFVADSLKTHHDIVLTAVRQSGVALQYAGESLKKNRDLVFEAVSRNWLALEHADKSLNKDRDLVRTAVRKCGLALEYADQSLKKDREFVLEAVRRDGRVLLHADESLKKSQDIVLEAVRSGTSGCALKYADESLRKNLEFVLAAVRRNPVALKYVDRSLKKKNRGILLEVLREKGFVADESLKDIKRMKKERMNVGQTSDEEGHPCKGTG